MRHYIFVMILMFLGVATTSYAQRTRKVHGEYIYHAPENVSLEQAKKTALSRAQIQALGDEFGTVVAQHNATLMNNTNGSTQTDFTSLSSSDVKGEWLETIGEPKYEISYEQGMLVVKMLGKRKGTGAGCHTEQFRCQDSEKRYRRQIRKRQLQEWRRSLSLLPVIYQGIRSRLSDR